MKTQTDLLITGLERLIERGIETEYIELLLSYAKEIKQINEPEDN